MRPTSTPDPSEHARQSVKKRATNGSARIETGADGRFPLSLRRNSPIWSGVWTAAWKVVGLTSVVAGFRIRFTVSQDRSSSVGSVRRETVARRIHAHRPGDRAPTVIRIDR